MSAWFVSERVVFSRHKGKKWLAEVLRDVMEPFVTVGSNGFRWVKKVPPKKFKQCLEWSNRGFQKIFYAIGCTRSSTSSNAVLEGDVLPDTQNPDLISAGSHVFTDNTRVSMENGDDPEPSVIHDTIQLADEATDPSLSARSTHFATLVRKVIMVNRTAGSSPEVRQTSTNVVGAPLRLDTMPMSFRVAGLVPKLRNMVPTQDIVAHAASVRHIQVPSSSSLF